MAIPKIPKIPKIKVLEESKGGTKNTIKAVLIGVLILLLGAFGLEFSNTDFDLGALLQGESLQDAKVVRDGEGNILFDKEGNITTNSSLGKKASDYNCDDFESQPEAQKFFENVGGGESQDLFRLDGDKDGSACEALPAGN